MVNAFRLKPKGDDKMKLNYVEDQMKGAVKFYPDKAATEKAHAEMIQRRPADADFILVGELEDKADIIAFLNNQFAAI